MPLNMYMLLPINSKRNINRFLVKFDVKFGNLIAQSIEAFYEIVRWFV